ncbi:23S rRNA (uracil(1939)-C(5))-methyltransferase RlmD [Ferruginibacter sp. HRS2-29]|uniref:23S rRNA (uracil(1939)-C(5))-methyltransferase RlmD n=1 Tax=Ferruginibacter sp. HRS2-29 TaxID=2487334 RepID=UPI0020CE75B9|nr:23S rRNA (uracil(1939)-C(5))-methyltransferase RlmD [Ferruginibacter sp. HRS2-29]
MSKKNKKFILPAIEVTDYAAEGKALARHEGKVIFIEGAVPGDVADIFITKNKKDWAEGRVNKMVSLSAERVDPFCQHFGVCGGCKWQMLPYPKQLQYKQQEAEQNLRRIGRLTEVPILPIVGAGATREYRNKLEFTASNKRFLSKDEINTDGIVPQQNALGFHVPRIFDKTIDIFECHLMDEVNNRIRNTIRDFARANDIAFYDIREHTGWLRNIIVRYCSTGELMVNICINHEDEANRVAMLDHLLKEVPGITTLLYTINPKWNDSIYDLTPITYYGKGYVTEMLEEFRFIISPKSFFQTNTKQAEQLYRITRDFAGLTGNEVLYDLYCGTGSIGIFCSKGAKKVIGVELIEDAIEDAKKNAALNNIGHTHFFAGDVIKICDDAFFAEHGRPDIVITDPPRAGMHEKLVNKLLEIAAPKIVYVSCNTATQARDIALLSEKYQVEKVQPVDMFPHTHHIESVALLTLK